VSIAHPFLGAFVVLCGILFLVLVYKPGWPEVAVSKTDKRLSGYIGAAIIALGAVLAIWPF
jgi:hypothetical protein